MARFSGSSTEPPPHPGGTLHAVTCTFRLVPLQQIPGILPQKRFQLIVAVRLAVRPGADEEGGVEAVPRVVGVPVVDP